MLELLRETADEWVTFPEWGQVIPHAIDECAE